MLVRTIGGVIVSLNGKTHNLVRDYDAKYVRRTIDVRSRVCFAGGMTS